MSNMTDLLICGWKGKPVSAVNPRKRCRFRFKVKVYAGHDFPSIFLTLFKLIRFAATVLIEILQIVIVSPT
jgi:hypothetical protein